MDQTSSNHNFDDIDHNNLKESENNWNIFDFGYYLMIIHQ